MNIAGPAPKCLYTCWGYRDCVEYQMGCIGYGKKMPNMASITDRYIPERIIKCMFEKCKFGKMYTPHPAHRINDTTNRNCAKDVRSAVYAKSVFSVF